MTQSLPSALRDLLEKLEFLSMVEEGQKPCMNTMEIVDGGWKGAIYRMRTAENRENTLLQIEAIVDKTMEALNAYNGDFLRITVQTLAKARGGIKNLTVTYKDHPRTVSRINVILRNVDLQLEKYKS